MRNILKIALFYKLFGHIEKNFKKRLTLTLYFAIMPRIAENCYGKTEYILFLALP